MKRFILFTISIILFGCSAPEKKLDNTFYPFNNAMRTLQNIPEGVDSQSKLIKKLGYKGFGGHHSEDYFVRRAALDKAGLEMPEIYVPATINEDGSVTYLNELHEIIEDSKNRDLLVSLAVFGESFKENKEEGDKHLVKSIQKLADFAAPFKVKIAV